LAEQLYLQIFPLKKMKYELGLQEDDQLQLQDQLVVESRFQSAIYIVSVRIFFFLFSSLTVLITKGTICHDYDEA
jgi:hypothetical protein